MGTQEEQGRRKAKKNEIKKLILETIKVAGLVSVLVVAPNVVGAMAKTGLIRSPRQKDLIERSYQRLVRQGLLRFEGKSLRLTPKGEQALQLLEFQNYRQQKPRRWDGKWRVIIFDIPEPRRGLRQKVRTTLRTMGFERIQDSVWAYPYDCEDVITLLKADFKIGKDILYMIVESIENDGWLRKEFKLPAA